MTETLQSEQPALEGALGAVPLVYLLQRGLSYAQQGLGAEAATLFALVREQLASSRGDLINLLDQFLHDYADYQRIEHSLQEVSARFASAHLELQARIASFEAALSTMMKGAVSDRYAHLSADGKEPAISSHPGVPAEQPRGAPPVIPPPLTDHNVALAPLSITCFGHFEVRRSGQSVTLCANRNGQRILRYLVSQPGRGATSDVLQTLLWPEDEAEVASGKLHLAISALRRSLSDDPVCKANRGYIVRKQNTYALNPSATIQVDVDEFLRCYRVGQQRSEERVNHYERACQLYTGPFLTEDIYADWSFIPREQLARAYLAMRNDLTDHYLTTRRYEDAIQSAHAVLKENRCDEMAHRHLIQVYIAQGRRSEALQQYQRCEHVLREELGVKPLPETTLTIQALLANDSLST